MRTGAALQPAEKPIQLPPIRPRREDDDVSQTSVINIFNDSQSDKYKAQESGGDIFVRAPTIIQPGSRNDPFNLRA